MLILYTKNNCPYCEKVKRIFEERRLTYEERNITDEQFLKEMKDLGAKTMPFMYDTTANVKMGESDDIIDYASEYSF